MRSCLQRAAPSTWYMVRCEVNVSIGVKSVRPGQKYLGVSPGSDIDSLCGLSESAKASGSWFPW